MNLEQFKSFSLRRIFRLGTKRVEKAEEKTLEAHSKAIEKQRQKNLKNAHKISTRNSPCVCKHASSQHNHQTGCSECECTQFMVDEQALAKLVEKTQRKKLPLGERWILFLDEHFRADDEPETEEEKRERIRNALMHPSAEREIRQGDAWAERIFSPRGWYL